MHPFIRIAHCFCCTAALLALSLPVVAQTPLGVVSIPTGTDTAVNPPAAGTRPTFFIETIGPITIDTNDSLNSWKNFLTLDIHNGGLRNGETFEIRTTLQVGTFDPALSIDSWTGWKERVLTDDWQWIDGLAYQVSTSPTPLPGASTTIQATARANDTIQLAFDPLATGDTFFATKHLQYTGSDITPGEVVTVGIGIIANPTVPEPGSLALLALGGLMLARRRRA